MRDFKYTNALIHETSPYLLQHAHNPVNWYPWGEEALSRARREDKPIFLSIGYSACHWCHVMERESFENEETARLLNESFISIKVDREERPDLDAIYMAVVQMLTGSGGWPMTLFLTPDQVPFFSGTYFPPESRGRYPGFRQIIQEVARAYREQRQSVENNADTIQQELQRLGTLPDGDAKLHPDILEEAASEMISDYDPRQGGFGPAPKFPPSMTLGFLMRSWLRTGRKQFLEIVENTLIHMARGGIFDQIGGGFHRYSVDAEWLVPHFEKMLYDNALLSRAYLDAFLLTGQGFYRKIAEETLDYVLREMTSPEGGFYSSQDADSEGREGAFFVWSDREVRSVLAAEEADIFCRYFGITPEGNFEGFNILNIPRLGSVVAGLCNVSEERLLEAVQSGRRKLFEVREGRVRPARDEKILTAWNGLMLRSFAEAAAGLDRPDYRDAAVRNAEFLLSRLQGDGKLLRSYKDGEARFNAYLEDYAYLIDGLLSLYEACFDSRWIREAERLANRLTAEFWDSQGDGFFFTSADHEALIHRPKEFYDHAVPSGNSVAALALLRLWKFTGEETWSRYPVAIFRRMSDPVRRNPGAYAHLLCAMDFYFGRPKEIAVAGCADRDDTRALLDEIFHAYRPNKVVSCGLEADVFLLNEKKPIDGRPAVYVCEDFTCKAPVTSVEDLRDQLVRP